MNQGGRRRVTSHDIARAAKVSQPTVSRALRGDPRVAAATAELIRETAERLGYQPHAAARSLITSRSDTAGIVVSDLNNPFYPELVQALHERLEELGQRPILFTERTGEMDSQRVAAMMRAGVIDGVILASATIDEQTRALLADAPGQIVLVVREVPGWEGDAVVADNRGGAATAAELLISLGHKRIAMIPGAADTSTAQERGQSFQATIEAAGLSLLPPAPGGGAFSYEAGREACATLVRGEQPPTAIFCANDVIALGALDAARQLGVPVPEMLSIIGFDDMALAAWSSFRLTTVHQPLREMAGRAAERLVERIDGVVEGGGRVVFPTHLVVRETTGPPPG